MNSSLKESSDIVVWHIDLDHPSFQTPEHLSVLTEQERARSNSFKFEKDQRRWSSARSAMRRILAKASGIDAELLEIHAGTYGKPFLANKAAKEIHFNLSHSYGTALLAVSTNGEVGIDVELHNRQGLSDINDLAKTFMTAEELTVFNQVRVSQRAGFVYNLWVSKESLLKAVGVGLSEGLNNVNLLEVSQAILDEKQPLYSADPFTVRNQFGERKLKFIHSLESTSSALVYECHAHVDMQLKTYKN